MCAKVLAPRSPGVCSRRAFGLDGKAWTLAEFGRSDEAITIYRHVVDRFGETQEPELRMQAALALCNIGATLRDSGEAEAATAVYDELIARFSGDDVPAIQEHVAHWRLAPCARTAACASVLSPEEEWTQGPGFRSRALGPARAAA